MTESRSIQPTSLAQLMVTTVVLGSLWGLSEVVLGGALVAAGFAYRAAVLSGIGLGLMAIAAGAHKSLWMPIAGALIAVSCMLLVVPILHVPAACKANSCLAVTLQGLAVPSVVAFAGPRMRRSPGSRFPAGALVAGLAAATFYSAGLHVAPCQYLLSFRQNGGLVAFLIAEGLPWAVVSAVTFPAGYALGERLEGISPIVESRRSAFYAFSTAIVVCCWAASGAAIRAGF
jgi:hypothetical protein